MTESSDLELRLELPFFLFFVTSLQAKIYIHKFPFEHQRLVTLYHLASLAESALNTFTLRMNVGLCWCSSLHTTVFSVSLHWSHMLTISLSLLTCVLFLYRKKNHLICRRCLKSLTKTADLSSAVSLLANCHQSE